VQRPGLMTKYTTYALITAAALLIFTDGATLLKVEVLQRSPQLLCTATTAAAC
jgi:hypothetical protein